MASLAKTMCRLHIMDVGENPLPCEGGEACPKELRCRRMAEKILALVEGLRKKGDE